MVIPLGVVPADPAPAGARRQPSGWACVPPFIVSVTEVLLGGANA
jgi:hypothetical protein